jgi:ATP-binding protein involved in chromosome partitioning
MDPRPAVIGERLKGVGRVLAVASGKGGVGKSTVASVLALTLAKMGKRVGLLDLDFHGPSTHVILGVGDAQPEEDKGVIPPLVAGVKYMSLICYIGGEPAPLRGADVTNAMLELLAVTQWGEIDYLIVDMPPGLGEATLDAVRYIEGAEFIVVTTPSKVAYEAVGRLLRLLDELGQPLLGVVENMRAQEAAAPPQGEHFIGGIRFDSGVESALGDAGRLLKTGFAQDLGEITHGLLSTGDSGSGR